MPLLPFPPSNWKIIIKGFRRWPLTSLKITSVYILAQMFAHQMHSFSKHSCIKCLVTFSLTSAGLWIYLDDHQNDDHFTGELFISCQIWHRPSIAHYIFSLSLSLSICSLFLSSVSICAMIAVCRVMFFFLSAHTIMKQSQADVPSWRALCGREWAALGQPLYFRIRSPCPLIDGDWISWDYLQ